MRLCTRIHDIDVERASWSPALSFGHGVCLPYLALGTIGHGDAQLFVPGTSQCARQLLLIPQKLT